MAAEKCAFYKDFARLLKFKIEPYYGTNGIFPIPKQQNILMIATIEKVQNLCSFSIILKGKLDCNPVD
jgi:hypothetical protein